MNKTYNINLAGQVFTIDELAYDQLRQYLDTIKSFFQRYEDAREITLDIENRIAEKLRYFLEFNQRQVVTLEDVQKVMEEMGTARDFEAFESATQTDDFSADAQTEPLENEFKPHLRLTRKKAGRVLGGVCSGISDYLNTEIWIIRLIFLISAFVLGVGIISYIALWISLPELELLQESDRIIGTTQDERSRRLYRNSSDKVLGGVASGLAAYFTVDPVIIRLLFFVSVFGGGFGLIAYPLLWLALPEAKTLVEKVEMTGRKANLDNIHEAVKGQHPEYQQFEKSPIARLILFPVRVIEVILRWISQNMGGLFKGVFDIVKMAIGLIISVFAALGALSTLLVFGAGIMISTTLLSPSGLPENVNNLSGSPSYDVFIILCFSTVLILPFLLVLNVGLRLVIKRTFFPRHLMRSLAYTWIIAFSLTIFNTFYILNQFSSEGHAQKTNRFELEKNKILRLDLKEVDNVYNNFNIEIGPINDTVLQVSQELTIRGKHRSTADKMAELVYQKMSLKDSIYSLDPEVNQRNMTAFRNPHVMNKIMIPYDKPFILNQGMVNKMQWESLIDTLYNWELANKTLVFSSEGVKCLNCGPSKLKQDKEEERKREEELQKENHDNT